MSLNIVKNGCIYPNYEYKVINGPIIYNGITYNTDDIFVGVSGLNFYNETNLIDLTPKMTSNTSPSGECIGDSVYRNYTTYDFWKAFNKTTNDSNDSWISEETVTIDFPHWIGYKFDDLTICNKFIVYPRNSSSTLPPKKIKIESSFDGITWIELYKYTENDFYYKSYSKCYNFNNETGYFYYRLFIEEAFGTTYVAVGDLKMMYEPQNDIIITLASKIKSQSVEYKEVNRDIKKITNSFNDLAIEYENPPYADKFTIKQTQFKNLTIDTPTQPKFGEVLKMTNIKMFSKPLNGYQRKMESNI